jgi:hypothetical protein
MLMKKQMENKFNRITDKNKPTQCPASVGHFFANFFLTFTTKTGKI